MPPRVALVVMDPCLRRGDEPEIAASVTFPNVMAGLHPGMTKGRRKPGSFRRAPLDEIFQGALLFRLEANQDPRIGLDHGTLD